VCLEEICFVFLRLRKTVEHPRFRRTGANDVDTNACAGEFDGCRLRDAFHGVLASDINRCAWAADFAVSDTAPVLRVAIDDYLKRSGVDSTPAHEAEPPLHGNVLDRFDAWRWAITYLRTEVSCFIANESSPQGRHTDSRFGAWLQKVEQISDLEVITFEVGRTNCARLEEDPIIV
jgi:hypothetical protein